MIVQDRRREWVLSIYIPFQKFYLTFWDVVPKLLHALYLNFSRTEVQTTSQDPDHLQMIMTDDLQPSSGVVWYIKLPLATSGNSVIKKTSFIDLFSECYPNLINIQKDKIRGVYKLKDISTGIQEKHSLKTLRSQQFKVLQKMEENKWSPTFFPL